MWDDGVQEIGDEGRMGVGDQGKKGGGGGKEESGYCCIREIAVMMSDPLPVNASASTCAILCDWDQRRKGRILSS